MAIAESKSLKPCAFYTSEICIRTCKAQPIPYIRFLKLARFYLAGLKIEKKKILRLLYKRRNYYSTLSVNRAYLGLVFLTCNRTKTRALASARIGCSSREACLLRIVIRFVTARFLHECYGPAYACLFHTSEAAAVSHSVNNNFRVVDFDLTQKYVILSCGHKS